MKKILLILFLLFTVNSYGEDTETQNLADITSPATDDDMYIVKDPDGTPASRKISVGALFAVSPDMDSSGNVTITEADISDLSHTTDTNANTICTGTTTYLDGEGNCDDISGVYEPAGITESDISDLDHTATDITADIVDFNDIKQDNTLAGNPVFLVDECFLVATATGGGFICEGSTADTNEQLYLFPDVNGADTTEEITTNASTQTLTNKTINTSSNTITVVEADISDLSHTVETNSLETTITGIADTELFIGNGVDSGTFTAMSGDATLSNAGVLSLANDVVAPAEMADADHGDFTYSTGNATLDTNSVADNEIDYTAVTLNDLTFDVNSVSKTEFGHLNGVTSALQTQIDGKEGTLSNEAGLYSALSDVSLFLEDVVDDTTPTLGGDLDAGNNQITGVDLITITGQGSDYTATFDAWVDISTNQVWDVSGLVLPRAVEFSGTHTIKQGGNGFGLGFLFHAKPVLQFTDSSASTGPFYVLVNQTDFDAVDNTITQAISYEMLFQQDFTASGTGSWTTTDWHTIQGGGQVKTGATVTNRRFINIPDTGGSGTLTNQAGVVINDLGKGSNNTHILYGSSTIPSGDYGIYQANTDENYFQGQMTVDNSSGGCIMFRDTDDAGWTEVGCLNGVCYETTDADGVCDGA